MKRKDILVIVFVIGFSAVFSFFVSNLIFGSPAQHQQQVEDVAPIADSFEKPDSRYFNEKSLNPTKVITIGGDNNQQPFNNPGQ